MLTRRALLASAVTSQTMGPAVQILDRAVASGQLRSAVLRITQGKTVFEKAFGAAQPSTPFLIASITKPMTVAAVLTVPEIKLDDAVAKHLPQLDPRITIRHLLCHMSGLPDMLPANIDLRKRHAPLPEWVRQTLTTPLLFPPGSKVSYQSMGILLAAHLAEKFAATPFPKLIAQRVFEPLGMRNTVLGQVPGAALCQVEFADPPGESDWSWNSPWWRSLGAPWGGAHSTAADITTFLRSFFKPSATAQLMLARQNPQYGLGLRMSPEGFGHGGSTGTLCWANAKHDATFVLLTSLPASVSQKTVLDPVSRAAQAALGIAPAA